MSNDIRPLLNKPSRNYSIDLLRVISMCMIVALHVIGRCSLIDNSQPGSIRFVAYWVIEAICLCGVNCFGLISGYVGYKSRHRLSGIFKLWLEIASIVFIGNCILVICGAIDMKTALVQSFFPITTRYYWFASAYIALCFFMPLIDSAIEHCSPSSVKLALVAFFLLASCCSLLPWDSAPYSLEGGYSIAWLAYLYAVGAFFKKNGLPCLSRCKHLGVFFCCVASTVLLRAILPYQTGVLGQLDLLTWSPRLDNYVSPFILLQAVALLGYFLSVKVPDALQTSLRHITPYIFGIYLIHDHRLVGIFVFPKLASAILNLSTPYAIVTCNCLVALIFIVSLILSVLRTLALNHTPLISFPEKIEKLMLSLVNR